LEEKEKSEESEEQIGGKREIGGRGVVETWGLLLLFDHGERFAPVMVIGLLMMFNVLCAFCWADRPTRDTMEMGLRNQESK